MSRLPVVGSDNGTWGDILNDYLLVSHNADGTLQATAAPPGQAVFSHSSTLSVITGAGKFYVPYNAVIQGVVAAVGTAPTGASVICDVNLNGTTVFTTQANRPTITAGNSKVSAAAVPDITALSAGDLLSVDIDQVGSGTAGSDLTVIVLFAR